MIWQLRFRRQYRPGDLIVIDGEYHQASTLNFYTHIPVRVLHAPSGNLWYGEKFPDAPHVFETPQSFADLWSGSARVFLWTDQEDPKELLGMPHSCWPAVAGRQFSRTTHNETTLLNEQSGPNLPVIIVLLR